MITVVVCSRGYGYATLTVRVTYDHCSGIGNGVLSQQVIPPLTLTLTPELPGSTL